MTQSQIAAIRPAMTKRTGGRILVDQLRIQGCDRIFTVPGESFLAVLDALHDTPEIDTIVCRQEGGVAYMADADGKMTGRPGIAFVTRGPGATNASPGIHIAKQDSTPMILFVGQIERGMREREAFQELDYRAAFGPLAKWATEVDDPARFPEIVSRAFYVATSGRPGPVVIALPEDVLTEMAAVADAPRYQIVETHPGLTQMAELQKLLSAKDAADPGSQPATPQGDEVTNTLAGDGPETGAAEGAVFGATPTASDENNENAQGEQV